MDDLIGACTLSAECLTITCVNDDSTTITVTLGPCRQVVTLSISGGPLSDFTQTFNESGVGIVDVFDVPALLVDVTLARLEEGGAAVALQVNTPIAYLKDSGYYML